MSVSYTQASYIGNYRKFPPSISSYTQPPYVNTYRKVPLSTLSYTQPSYMNTYRKFPLSTSSYTQLTYMTPVYAIAIPSVIGVNHIETTVQISIPVNNEEPDPLTIRSIDLDLKTFTILTQLPLIIDAYSKSEVVLVLNYPIQQTATKYELDYQKPPVFNFLVTLNFDVGTPHDVSIVGSAGNILQYQFTEGAVETKEWKTQTLTANKGTEQRIALRYNPRTTLSVTYPINNENIQKLTNAVYNNMASWFFVPMWADAIQVDTLPATTSVIAIDSSIHFDFPTKLIMICESYSKFVICNVTSCNIVTDFENNVLNPLIDNTITIDPPLAMDYINPYVVFINAAQQYDVLTRKTDAYDSELSVKWHLMPTIQNYLHSDQSPAITFPSYNNSMLMIEPSLMSETMAQDKIKKRIDLLDYGIGDVASFDPWSSAKYSRSVFFITDDPYAITRFRTFINALLGSFHSFYLPTFENDIRINQTGQINTTIIAHNDLMLPNARSRLSDLFIRFNDGTYLCAKVSNAAHTNSELEITVADPIIRNAEEVVSISILMKVKLDSDSIEFKWGSGRVLRTTFNAIEVSFI